MVKWPKNVIVHLPHLEVHYLCLRPPELNHVTGVATGIHHCVYSMQTQKNKYI